MFHMVDEQESPAWARVCDLVFQDRRDDVGYYLEQASPKGSSVLEIGCSTGRITEFLADFGKEVHAVDPSAEMIEIARNKIEKLSNPGQVLFSQTTLPELNIISDRKFSLAIVPSLAFMSILSSEEQQKFLHNLRRYLNPGGKLVLEMNVPETRMMFLNEGNWVSTTIRMKPRIQAETDKFRVSVPEKSLNLILILYMRFSMWVKYCI